MFEETIASKTKSVWMKLAGKKMVADSFYLAGGTALALQLGHRESVDLDFFATNFPKGSLLLAEIRNLGPEVVYQDEDTVDCFIDGVKVSFLLYKYPIIWPLVDFWGLKMADFRDIGAMKLSAVASRGSKKDFIDIYFLLQKLSLEELILAFRQKFEGVDYSFIHLKKSLIYFETAEEEPMPKMVKKVEWGKVKEELERVID